MFLNVSAFMWPMGEDWRRVATAADARLSELRMDRTAFAEAAGVDRKSVDNFLDRAVKPRTSTRGSYEQALGWAYGSLLAIARGGSASLSEPDVVPETDASGFVGTGAGGPVGLTNDEVLALIRESRRLADELERRVQGAERNLRDS